MMPCSQPVSWLKLERHQLGELAPAEALEVDRHVADCGYCGAHLQSIADDGWRLPPLPDVAPAASLGWGWAWAPALALAAAVLLVVQFPVSTSPNSFKGGELALEVVRERGGEVEMAPEVYADGDRVKVLVTCPPSLGAVDVVVFQNGNAKRPFGSISGCGNRVVVPGAASLTGPGDIEICVYEGRTTQMREPADGACRTLRWTP